AFERASRNSRRQIEDWGATTTSDRTTDGRAMTDWKRRPDWKHQHVQDDPKAIRSRTTPAPRTRPVATRVGSVGGGLRRLHAAFRGIRELTRTGIRDAGCVAAPRRSSFLINRRIDRSEEHTSE